MVRSATALAAVLILPGFLLAQQAPPGSHKVVRGDNLWDLAEHFYKDPWQWRRIWQANKDKIKDPNLIFPGQLFEIPGAHGKVTEVEVEPGPAKASPAAEPAPSQGEPAPTPGEPAAAGPEGTVFRRGSTQGATRARFLDEELPSVTRSDVYAAPWLIRGDSVPAHVGTVVAHVGPATPSDMLVPYDHVELDMQGVTPHVGERFLTYRVTRTIPEVGRVVSPTGTITVSEILGGRVTGTVTDVYGRLATGDLVGPLPSYDLEPSQRTGAVADGPSAMVMGLADPAQLAGMGEIVFLDLGAADGIGVGDEFDVRDWHEGGHRLLGRLRVVGVKEHTSSARVVYLLDDVFHQGVVVRLARKMNRR